MEFSIYKQIVSRGNFIYFLRVKDMSRIGES